jgi:hypothetical protein
MLVCDSIEIAYPPGVACLDQVVHKTGPMDQRVS